MKKIELKIRTYPDPVLRKKAQRVVKVVEEHRAIISGMAKLMYSSSGIGLAAPQVGISLSMITVDCGLGLYKLINPKILKKEGQQAIEEGCLSVPGVCVKVRRARKIVVQAQDEYGKLLNIEAEDLFACVIQHEMEHLRGGLIIDHASFLEKLKMKKNLVHLKTKAGYERLPESETKSCKLQL
ncbi:MAG: peptide deformylase [Candidatus Omnitrophica bacterium]|nr:peptide deformylase [Candidatus Omnitrophota bacterium]